MSNSPKTIEQLQQDRDTVVRRRDEADKDIKRIDGLFEAYERLRQANVIVGQSTGPVIRRRLGATEAGKVAYRDDKIMAAILDHHQKDEFTVPDLTVLVKNVTKRSIKRALDDMIGRSEVKIVREGYKRRATIYRLAKKWRISAE